MTTAIQYDTNSVQNALNNHALEYNADLFLRLKRQGTLTTISDLKMALAALTVSVEDIEREETAFHITLDSDTHPIRIECLRVLCKLFGSVGMEYSIVAAEPVNMI